MRLKRIISIIVALSVLIFSLFSCAKTPEGLIEKADKKLARNDYTVEVEVEYIADNQGIAGLFDQLDSGETAIMYDGDNVKIEQRSSINYGEGNTDFYGNYVIIDGTVYSNSGYTSALGNSFNKVKADISDEEKISLIEKAGVIIGIGIEDFATVNLEKRDGEYQILCSEAKTDLNIRLENILILQMQGEVESVEVNNARMIIEIDDGKYDTVRLLCDYNVKLSSQTYSVNAEFELEYDYDDHIRITMPGDAYEYNDTEFENILNTL